MLFTIKTGRFLMKNISAKNYNMQRQSIIILIQPDKEPIARGNFKKLCLEFRFPYHTLARLKFPITYKESIIHKVEFK